MISGISSFNATSLSEMRQAMFNKIDTSGDGAIDKNEITALLEQNASTLVEGLFGTLDSNQDGLISQIESDSGLAKLGREMRNGGNGPSGLSGTQPPRPEEVFDKADANGDGEVTQEELEAVIGKKGGDLFAQIDTDGDGTISRAEDEAFRQGMEKEIGHGGPSLSGLSGTQPPRPEEVFDAADVNGDGAVTQEELEAVIGEKGGDLFAQIDTDSDGSISRTEDEVFRRQMTEKAPPQEADDATAISGFSLNWQMEMLGAMFKGLAASTSAGEATSLYV